MDDTTHVIRAASGEPVLHQARLARSSRSRSKGLLGRTELAPGEGLILPVAGPAVPGVAHLLKSIHMFFMRMPLDVVFCDRELCVLKVVHDLRPWRLATHPRARYVLEIGPGEARRLGLQPGDRLAADPPL